MSTINMNDIVMLGSIAAETAAKLIETQRPKLKEYLSDRFIDDAYRKLSFVNWTKEDVETVNPDYYLQMSDFGIFGGLWEYGENRKVGLSVKLHDISIFQEVVEICEIFDINPYVCSSESVYLLSVKSGYEVIHLFEKKGIYATVIGRENKTKDRIIINGDETRYLTPINRSHYFKDRFKG